MKLETQDRLAIIELTSLYANCMDTKDFKTWLTTWSSEGTWEGPAGSFTGHEKLTQFIETLSPRLEGVRHAMTNHVIEPIPSDSQKRARQRCYMLIIQTEGEAGLLGSAVYEDELREENGEWKFTYRKITFDPAFRPKKN